MTYELISTVINIVLGGGLIVTLATLRSTRQEAGAKAEKAAAEARADEIKNVESAIKIWREVAENMTDKYTDLSVQVENLAKEVNRLRQVNNKILKLLDKITPDNLEHTVNEIKEQLS